MLSSEGRLPASPRSIDDAVDLQRKKAALELACAEARRVLPCASLLYTYDSSSDLPQVRVLHDDSANGLPDEDALLLRQLVQDNAGLGPDDFDINGTIVCPVRHYGSRHAPLTEARADEQDSNTTRNTADPAVAPVVDPMIPTPASRLSGDYFVGGYANVVVEHAYVRSELNMQDSRQVDIRLGVARADEMEPVAQSRLDLNAFATSSAMSCVVKISSDATSTETLILAAGHSDNVDPTEQCVTAYLTQMTGGPRAVNLDLHCYSDPSTIGARENICTIPVLFGGLPVRSHFAMETMPSAYDATDNNQQQPTEAIADVDAFTLRPPTECTWLSDEIGLLQETKLYAIDTVLSHKHMPFLVLPKVDTIERGGFLGNVNFTTYRPLEGRKTHVLTVVGFLHRVVFDARAHRINEFLYVALPRDNDPANLPEHGDSGSPILIEVDVVKAVNGRATSVKETRLHSFVSARSARYALTAYGQPISQTCALAHTEAALPASEKLNVRPCNAMKRVKVVRYDGDALQMAASWCAVLTESGLV